METKENNLSLENTAEEIRGWADTLGTTIDDLISHSGQSYTDAEGNVLPNPYFSSSVWEEFLSNKNLVESDRSCVSRIDFICKSRGVILNILRCNNGGSKGNKAYNQLTLLISEALGGNYNEGVIFDVMKDNLLNSVKEIKSDDNELGENDINLNEIDINKFFKRVDGIKRKNTPLYIDLCKMVYSNFANDKSFVQWSINFYKMICGSIRDLRGVAGPLRKTIWLKSNYGVNWGEKCYRFISSFLHTDLSESGKNNINQRNSGAVGTYRWNKEGKEED